MKLSLYRVLITFTLACYALTSSAAGTKVEGSVWTYDCRSSERPVIEQAITAVIGTTPSSDFRKLFERHLRLRGDAIPESDKPRYWQELKAKPELRNTPIYGSESAPSRAGLKKLKPVLDLFRRDWDVAVIQQKAPFFGAFRQCIFIISTGLLEMVSDAQLRAFAAHDLSHECFIEELREADRLNSIAAYHLAEYKSDLVAALACIVLKDDPLSLASGVALIEVYYLKTDPSALHDNKHPDAQQRRHCMEVFLTKIGWNVHVCTCPSTRSTARSGPERAARRSSKE
jgi:hypothetical protein